ncbi:MAG: CBS domain-containing protein [Peptococcaceae bacterium]|nr:MAG: CBS domain-containing protein [Peptococcaceae bacterium]
MKIAPGDVQVRRGATLKEAIETMDRMTSGVALIVDEEGCLIGILTDGDIRRAILRNVDLNSSIEKVMNRSPITATRDFTRKQLMHLIRCKSISHLPVVDSRNRVVRIIFAHEFINGGDLPARALIMAGGLGTRLRPLTDDLPKPLLKVGSKPLLEMIVEQLADAGVKNIYLSIRYKGGKIEEYFGDGARWGVRISYLKENKRLGTAGPLGLIKEDFAEPVLVVNGDILSKVNFKRMVDFHLENRAEMTVAVKQHVIEVPYGVVKVENDELVGMSEKPMLKFFINAGIYLLNAGVKDCITPDTYFDMSDLITLLINRKSRVCSYPIREYWADIGSPGDYEKAIDDYAKHFQKNPEEEPESKNIYALGGR